jgi:hypothetical protein
MEHISFEKMCEMFADVREARCIENENDMVILCCGPEGSGKSTTILSLAHLIDPAFNIDRVFTKWKPFVHANYLATAAYAKQLGPEMQERISKKIGLDIDKLTQEDNLHLTPGSVIMADEAATMAFNREAMSKANVSQAKLYISNRYLRLIHFFLCPKPGSLDIYLRNERVKYFLWCEDFGQLRKPDRVLLIYSREDYCRILATDGYWRMFTLGGKVLASSIEPTYWVKIPDLINPSGNKNHDKTFIPPELLKEYRRRKVEGGLELITEILDKDLVEETSKVNHVERLVRPDENVRDWVTRTEQSPKDYTRYGGKKIRKKAKKD